MRASKNSSSDDIRERYLGEIAPLLDAARPVNSLSEVQKKQVRKRIVRTLFRTRFLGFRVRLVPALAALGMLVVGGAAFATAERLGLIAKLGTKKAIAPASQPKQDVRKRKGHGGRPDTRTRGPGEPESAAVEVDLASAEASTVVLPEVPDPLLLPIVEASTVGWSLLVETRAQTTTTPVARASIGSADVPAKPRRRPSKLLAYAAPAPVMAAPAPVMAAPALVMAAPVPAYAGQVAFRETAAPERPTLVQVQPPRASVASPAAPTAVAAPSLPAAVVAQPVPAPRTALSDQALFGQAMRKLRVENDPSAALVALQEHARAYPRSSFVGERSALEVEALLALHRDRDALARLDTMELDELPRSGERFVVRGELRAAARRWPEASADFDRALSRVSGSPAWHERALWGRGAARLRCGEREAGMADIERYLGSYPHGRFAATAAKFFPAR
jgi:hypothetical protein